MQNIRSQTTGTSVSREHFEQLVAAKVAQLLSTPRSKMRHGVAEDRAFERTLVDW